MKKQVIREGDLIKVINPEFFIRCGYEETVFGMMEKIKSKHLEHIVSSLREVVPNLDYNSTSFNKILKELAYLKCHEIHFGGNERKLFLQKKDNLLNKFFVVQGKKVCKTGTYVKGYSSTTYDGEYDYEPSYLKNEKTHVILELSPKDYTYYDTYDLSIIQIEQKNVELIQRGNFNKKYSLKKNKKR